MGYFSQTVTVDSSSQDLSRLDFLTPLVTDLKVLHVGFVDYPITKPKKNLHLRIAPVCKRIDGIDPNATDEIKLVLSVEINILEFFEVSIFVVLSVFSGNKEVNLSIVFVSSGTLDTGYLGNPFVSHISFLFVLLIKNLNKLNIVSF